MKRMGFWILIVAVVALLVVFRVLPTDPQRWHVPVEATADRDFSSGAIRVVPAEDGTLARLDEIARDTPRTRSIAGSVEEGRITYETRTLVFGFPDYTTAEVADGQLRLHARQRFGSSDLGVNAKRVDGWLSQL